tara:strand:- start:2274 stop:2411 length:138 start_codon:yes stop_codon:yes gene_type:complete
MLLFENTSVVFFDITVGEIYSGISGVVSFSFMQHKNAFPRWFSAR